MVHVRLGTLLKTRAWKNVIELIGIDLPEKPRVIDVGTALTDAVDLAVVLFLKPVYQLGAGGRA